MYYHNKQGLSSPGLNPYSISIKIIQQCNTEQQRRSATARDDYRSDDRPRTKLQVDTKTKDQRLPRHSKDSNTIQRNNTSAARGGTHKYVSHYIVTQTRTHRTNHLPLQEPLQTHLFTLDYRHHQESTPKRHTRSTICPTGRHSQQHHTTPTLQHAKLKMSDMTTKKF